MTSIEQPIPSTHTTPFLEHVARDLFQKYGNDLSRLTIVFPNKRASLFLNEHLANQTTQPIWCPHYTTISDLFRAHSTLSVADDIKLICDLWRSFTTCSKIEETLDKFYGWGVVLLSDFDDIDKSMANAHGVFANLSDLHSYDTAEYLTDEQVKVLNHFFKDFDENKTSELRKKFLDFWSHFGDVYDDFKHRLREQGLTYEGALYREVVEDEEVDFGDNTYIFVGFNALQEVERRLFKRLRQAGQALFYWDFDHYYLPVNPSKEASEAGLFIKRMLNDFPNEFDKTSDLYDHYRSPKSITFIGAPTDSVQGRYVSKWLSDSSRRDAGNHSAVVLCNEGLLPTVLHSIPDEVSSFNITTGFPLIQTAAASLVTLLAELAYQGRSGSNKYRHQFVLAVLRHPYAIYISPQASTLCETLTTKHIYYPTRKELQVDNGTLMLFRDTNIAQSKDREYDANREVNQWMLDILRHVAMAAQQTEKEEPLTHESLFRTYTLLNRMQNLLNSGDLKVDPSTYQRLLHEVICSTTIPFHGEPAIGLQVMGVLETRNLDFDHLLLLSCNEGNMPKGVDDPSFIPQSLRKAFGLTTIDTKTAIYAYYFFSMLQRATDITIMYGNNANNKDCGEKSRFMLQMMVENLHPITRKVLTTTNAPTIHERYSIEKSDAIMERLESIKRISPSSINTYLRCPLQYFFSYVGGIKEPDAKEDEIDNRLFGTIFHNAIQNIYEELTGVVQTSDEKVHPFANKGYPITSDIIDKALASPSVIERNLDKAFMKHLFKSDSTNDHPSYNGLQLINRRVIIHYLKQLLTIDKQLAPFTIRGHEGDVYTTIEVSTSRGKRRVQVGGTIDRLDEVTYGAARRIRVVDYKTGSKDIGKDGLKNVDAIFDPININKHSDYYLQAMLYAMIISRDKKYNPNGLPVCPALLFIQHAGGDDYNPILKFGSEEIIDMSKFNDVFEEKITGLLSHIMEPNEAFIPTDDKKTCNQCTYKDICGRTRQK